MWEVTEKYESIKNCTYYDLLAFLCWAISNLDDYQRKGLYKDFTKNYASIMDRRCTRFSFLTAKGTQGPIKYDALTSQMYLELQELFVAEETADWPMILAVAVQIDTIIEYEPNLRDFTRKRPVFDVSGVKCPPVDMKPIDVSNYFYSLNSLNPKTDSTFGEVLPRIPHRWARAETRSLASVQMNPLSYLKNYMWLPPSNTEWIVEHLLIQPINRNNRATKIITSPLSCQAPFLIEKKEDSYFNIKYIDEGSRQITSRIKSITDAAIAKQADIAVFPEMLATLECVAQCSDYFRRRTGKKCPYLFMLPTIEYQRNGKWVNQLIALDADGYCVFGYNKQHPFILESKDKGGKGEKLKFYEPIESDHRIYVIHVPNVGRIGIIICSDVFCEGYLNHVVKQYKITLLLHVVCSNGKDLLRRSLAVTQEQMCDVVICNTCAAWDTAELPFFERPPTNLSNKALVTAYIPNGHKDTDDKIFAGCGKTKDCKGCMLTLELPEAYVDPVKDIVVAYPENEEGNYV